MVIRSSSVLFKTDIDQRVDATLPPKTSYFPEIYLIEILRWPLVVVETSEKAHLIGN